MLIGVAVNQGNGVIMTITTAFSLLACRLPVRFVNYNQNNDLLQAPLLSDFRRGDKEM